MLVPVAVLGVLATFGGWIQWPPKWEPITHWLEPVARTLPAAVPTSTQEYVTSAIVVAAGAAGIAIAWAVYGTGRIRVPAAPALRRTLERKFYFDEAYDALFYRPAAALADWFRTDLEEPVVLQTGPDIGETALETGGLVRRLQTGLLRTYVFFLASGAAVVALVFLAVR